MAPIRLAIVNDYEIVVRGLAALIESDDRFAVVDIAVDDSVETHADIALYDTFGAADPDFASARPKGMGWNSTHPGCFGPMIARRRPVSRPRG